TNGEDMGQKTAQDRYLKKVLITLEYGPPISSQTLLEGTDKIIYADSLKDLLNNDYQKIYHNNILSVNDTTVTFQTSHLSAFGFLKYTNNQDKIQIVDSNFDKRCFISVVSHQFLFELTLFLVVFIIGIFNVKAYFEKVLE
ncbi:hypothetical protein MHK_006500, partial [Candidatus Magnetomorum sp. HK-1]